MSNILRVWKSVPNGLNVPNGPNWIIWDRGDEIWELKGNQLRHFEVLERNSINNVITERLRILPESAIPIEAIRHSVHGWEIEESAQEYLKNAFVETVNKKSKLQPAVCVSEEKTSHEKHLQPTPEIQEEESSQHFYNHPTELWSSLSQWIPQHALFQPSLHHQATLELSDTPAQTYPYQIDSSVNSRPAQGQHRHVRQGQQSKPYRPKPFLREIEIPKRPLFL